MVGSLKLSAFFAIATVPVDGTSAKAAGATFTVKFNPPSGWDTMSKSGVTTNINTSHQCITAMKEYENSSLEVRFEIILGYIFFHQHVFVSSFVVVVFPLFLLLLLLFVFVIFVFTDLCKTFAAIFIEPASNLKVEKCVTSLYT